MGSAAPVNAEGELGIIPLAHLLVYVLDRQLTGELFLNEPSGSEHVVRFVRGAPVKVRPGDGAKRLGDLLTAAGEVSPEALEAALDAGGRLGDALVEAGELSPLALDHALEMQFRQRMTRLFALPPETTFRCVEGSEELAAWGAEACVDPLEILWAGVREHADASTMAEGTIARLGDAIPRLHELAAAERFGFTGDERVALELLQANPMPFAELLSFEAVSEVTLRRVLYVLLLTRHVDGGRGLTPAGVDERPRLAPVGVARVQLRAAVHRLGAAAPDPPGDGVRAAVSPPTRAKRRSLAGGAAPVAGDAAASCGAEPPSSREPGAAEPSGVTSYPTPAEGSLTSSGIRQTEPGAARAEEGALVSSSLRGARAAGQQGVAAEPLDDRVARARRASSPAMARAVGFPIVDEDTGSSLVERVPLRASSRGAGRPPSGLYSLQSLEVAGSDGEVEIDVDLGEPPGSEPAVP